MSTSDNTRPPESAARLEHHIDAAVAEWLDGLTPAEDVELRRAGPWTLCSPTSGLLMLVQESLDRALT